MKSNSKIPKTKISNFEIQTNEISKSKKKDVNKKSSNFNIYSSKAQNSNLLTINSDGAIIINKKEVWDIVRHINDEDFKIFKKKDTEDFLSENGSLNSEIQNELTNKQQTKMIIKRPPSPSQDKDQRTGFEHQNHPSLNDAGSGSIREIVKTEECMTENQNILKMILGDIHHCQYSEIFKIFSREINDPTTLDYFIKLKESMAKEDNERLLNMLVFIVWSLRFMKIDPSLITNSKNLIVISNSFMIRGEAEATEMQQQDKAANFFSSSECNSSYVPEPLSMESGSVGPDHHENINNFQTPNFFSFNQGCQPISINCDQSENLPKEEKNILENKKITNNTDKTTPILAINDSKNQYQENQIIYNSNNLPIQNGVNTNKTNQILGIPLQAPNGTIYIPVPLSFLQGNLNLPLIGSALPVINNAQNQYFSQPVNPNTLPSQYPSSCNTGSFYRTEIVTSGQFQNNFAVDKYQTKQQGNYDPITLNESNNINNTMSTILSKGNNSLQTSSFVKKEPDYIDITVGEEKGDDQDFDQVYTEIVGIFSKPITEKTFKDLRKFMYESQVKKIEDVIMKNPFTYLNKKQYILLFRTKKNEMYLKIDPQEKKYSISRFNIRHSSSNLNSKN